MVSLLLPAYEHIQMSVKECTVPDARYLFLFFSFYSHSSRRQWPGMTLGNPWGAVCGFLAYSIIIAIREITNPIAYIHIIALSDSTYYRKWSRTVLIFLRTFLSFQQYITRNHRTITSSLYYCRNISIYGAGAITITIFLSTLLSFYYYYKKTYVHLLPYYIIAETSLFREQGPWIFL